MEDRIKSELEKQKESLERILREKHGLSADAIKTVQNILDISTMDLIRLMREGKSAHEKFFSDIIMNSIDGVVGVDNDFKIFLWNKGAEAVFGYTREEVTGQDFGILIPKHLRNKGEREFLINEVRTKGYLSNYETERFRKDGKKVNVNITRIAIKDENNKTIGSVAIVRDITKIKQLEKELREKENLALIGEVVSSIAHSLSNPLNIISGNADYLLFDKSEKDKEYEELKTILDETTRITKSIRHLLNFSRPVPVKKEMNNINSLIEEVILETKYLTEKKKVALKKQLNQGIPEFMFDRTQIHEAVSNIVTNAIQAIASQGEVRIKTAMNSEGVLVEISDSGSGIPKENLDRIFLPFFSSKEYGKGTGLGLAITKRIVKEHGGEINVRSLPGKGSTFTITFPSD